MLDQSTCLHLERFRKPKRPAASAKAANGSRNGACATKNGIGTKPLTVRLEREAVLAAARLT